MKQKILIAFLIVLFGIAGFSLMLMFSAKKVGVAPSASFDRQELKEDYDRNVKSIFQELIALVESDDKDQQKLQKLKEQTLGMRLPSEYKAMHLDLVLSIEKIALLQKQDSKDFGLKGRDEISKLKESYPALR